jgi:hypothetical protein
MPPAPSFTPCESPFVLAAAENFGGATQPDSGCEETTAYPHGAGAVHCEDRDFAGQDVHGPLSWRGAPSAAVAVFGVRGEHRARAERPGPKA